MVKALFLDRDGVINYDYGYVYKQSDFKFVDGIFSLCKQAQTFGYKLIVITNQSGIDRGYFTDNDFKIINDYMLHEFLKRDITITEVFYCPYLNHLDRKPSPSMFLKAKEKYDIDMSSSVSVGDNVRDIEAAFKAGVGRNFFLMKPDKVLLCPNSIPVNNLHEITSQL